MNLSERIRKFGPLLATYFMGQGMIQLLQLVSGFALVNWMSKSAYADYTLVMAILGMAAMLIDLGISQTLTGVIGSKVTDRRKVGRYLAACAYYRNRLLLFGVVALIPVFMWFGRKYAWTWVEGGLLFAAVAGVLTFQVMLSMYRPLLLLEKRLKESYTVGLGANGLRLVLIALAHLVHFLAAPVVVLIGTLKECIETIWLRKMTANMIAKPACGTDIATEKREILGQSVPRIPSLLFSAFSGQFIIFAMGIVGTRSGLAELGALSRIAMLFLILQHASGALVSPHFARLQSAVVKRQSVLLLLGMSLVSLLICGVVLMLPQWFLFILGADYAHLEFEVFLVAVAAMVRVLSVYAFAICLARKYIFPWYSVVDVLPQVIVIALAIVALDLSDLRNLLYFGIAMALVKLLSKLYIMYVGFRRELAAGEVSCD